MHPVSSCCDFHPRATFLVLSHPLARPLSIMAPRPFQQGPVPFAPRDPTPAGGPDRPRITSSVTPSKLFARFIAACDHTNALRAKGVRLPVRCMRPENGDVRPGFRDAPAISHRIRVVRCPLAGRKGNGVSYTLLKTRKSQKQRLQHNSASRAPLSLPRMGRSAPWCGAPGRATSAGPMVDGNGRSFG